MDWLETPIEVAVGAALTGLFIWLLRKSQRVHPSLVEFEGKRVLKMSPPWAMLALGIFGFVLVGSATVGTIVLVFSGPGPVSLLSDGIGVFVLFLGLAGLGMTVFILLFACHAAVSRIFVFNDGLLFKTFLRKRRFLKWTEIERVEHRPVRSDIVLVTADSATSAVDPDWNGVAYVYFCLDSFLEEPQWAGAREEFEKVLRKKGDLDELRRQFDELLVTHPLDSADPEGGWEEGEK